MRISEADQFDLFAHQRLSECGFNFSGLIIMPVDIASRSGAGEEIHVVRASYKTDVIQLRDSGIIKQLVPGFLIAYPTASSRIIFIPAV
jgi:hypothetical protein